MLAVVQPYSASPDVGHRARPTLSSTSSRSSSSNLASLQPPSLQRLQTISSAHPPPKKTSTPPLRPLTPTPTSLLPSHLPFDIHSYPAADLLKLLALLLTHIATANDHLSRPSPLSSGSSSNPSSPLDSTDPPPIWHTLTTASRGAISTPAATLTFHARNIPTISLEAYLLRILKYCPTTNHVFLSLLVYFDRMSKLSEDSVGRAFVIDSYNIHRLVIAGVTVASKFFSDVFYTNSRYAKVGGLPLPELNQLELQFLLLNDFRLVISSTEMQHYAEQLILFSKSSNSNATLLPTRANGFHASHTITSASFKKQLQETGGSVSEQPLVVHPHPSSSFPSTSNISSFPGAPKCSFDALGCVPAPVLPNAVNHSSAYHSQTHVPVPVYSHIRPNGAAHPSSTSSLSSHSSSHLDPHSLSHYCPQQPQLHSQPQQQHRHNQRLHHNRLASSSSISSAFTSPDIDVPDPDSQTDAEDADTSTDAGETDAGSETDEEPTIKAPPTVAGSVCSGASVWGDEADERMASP